MKRYLEVVECETDRVIDRVDVTDKSEKQAERVMDGVDRYLNHERYYTRFSAISCNARRLNQSTAIYLSSAKRRSQSRGERQLKTRQAAPTRMSSL